MKSYDAVIGPILLVRFQFHRHAVYLFGDDHGNKKNPKDTDSIDFEKNKTTINRASRITIERLIYELYERALKLNAYLNLFFEVIPSKKRADNISPDDKLSRFDRLMLMFDLYKFKAEKNVTFNPVDFRVWDHKDGSGEFQNLAINYFSLFVMLFRDKKFEKIKELFPIDTPDWDITLLKATLLGEGEGFKEIEIPDEYKFAFPENIKAYTQAQYFKALPHEGLKSIVKDLISKKVKSIFVDYKERTPDLKKKIDDMHMWYMDIPAFCILMEKIMPKPGLTVAYYGAEHVTNILPLIARIDPYFTVHSAGCEELDLPTEVKEELMEMI